MTSIWWPRVLTGLGVVGTITCLAFRCPISAAVVAFFTGPIALIAVLESI